MGHLGRRIDAMKSRTHVLIMFGLLLAFATLIADVAACGNFAETASISAASGDGAATAVAASVTNTGPAVQVTGFSGIRTFTVAQLGEMDSMEGYGGYTCPPHPGITGPTQYRGVALTELIESVGGLPDGSVVSVAASDGYVMTFSTDQIRNGGFTAYDPKAGTEVTIEDSPRLVVAYESQGELLSPEEGPFRLVFLTPEADQVVEGFLWVKWVTRIQVRGLEDEWTLRLAGATQKTLTRASFEALAAEAGNSATWEDIQGRTWTGISLGVLTALVANQTDDEVSGPDQQPAARGYKIEIVGTDGAAVELDPADIALDKVVVANKMEGNPLGDIEFPLRLVGAGLQSAQIVDGIREIRVHVQ
jgi:DMSO/TMAO reductase YedYZ molybdopterin-dependent catalytic subunit